MKPIIPDYIKLYDIDQSDLADVLAGGDINENIDATGNYIIDSSKSDISNSLIKLTQTISEFSKDKIDQNYSTEFTEFTNVQSVENSDLIVEDDIKTISDNQLQRESVLETQIDELSKIMELESQQSTKVKEEAEQTYNAMRGVIIEQRIKNNEGKTEADFQDAFPFLPIGADTPSDTSYDSSPFAIEPT